MAKSKKTSDGKMMAAAAAGAAVIGAGAYYLLGPNKKIHQKKAKALYEKMKREVKKEALKAKELSVPIYHKAVDVISENYAKQYQLHEKDIRAIAGKLKKEWSTLKKKANAPVKKASQTKITKNKKQK